MMDVYLLFDLIADIFTRLFGLLDSFVFQIHSYEVSLGGLIFVTFVVMFVVGLFWKGARA